MLCQMKIILAVGRMYGRIKKLLLKENLFESFTMPSERISDIRPAMLTLMTQNIAVFLRAI